jgi:hypothetical protein
VFHPSRASASLIVALVSSLVALPGVHAEPPADEEKPPAEASDAAVSWGEGRVMDGHRFPFPQFLPSSFVVSSFAVHAGVESRRVPNFPTDASTGSLTPKRIDLSTVSATQGVDATLRLHRLFALTFDLSGQARIGTNTDTLLGTGADYELGAGGGALLRLFRTHHFQLSLRARGGYHGGQHAGIAGFYQSVRGIAEQTVQRVARGEIGTLQAEEARLDNAFTQAARQLVSSTTGFGVSGMVTAAWAMSSWAGLQAMVGYAFDRTTNVADVFQLSTETSTRLRTTTQQSQIMAGLALDVGAASRGVPLDLVAEYELLPLMSRRRGGVGQASQSAIEHRIALGLYYSGRTDLQLGVSAYTLLAGLRELGAATQFSGRAYDAGGLFVFRYIW